MDDKRQGEECAFKGINQYHHLLLKKIFFLSYCSNPSNTISCKWLLIFTLILKVICLIDWGIVIYIKIVRVKIAIIVPIDMKITSVRLMKQHRRFFSECPISVKFILKNTIQLWVVMSSITLILWDYNHWG